MVTPIWVYDHILSGSELLPWCHDSNVLVKKAHHMVVSPCEAAELDILKLIFQVACLSSVLVDSEQFDVDPI